MPRSSGPGGPGFALHPIISDWTCFESQLAAFRAAVPAGGAPGPVVVRVNSPFTETRIDDAERAPLSGSVYQIEDDLQRLVELGVDHVMWDPNGVVPYETQLRLLEPLIAVRPS